MIFISYSSCDRKIAEALCTYLESKGIDCWVAFRDVTSGNFAGEITRALKAADIFLLIASKESCRSEHVKNEVTLAFNQKKHIIPYLIEDNPYDDDLEYFLSLKQHIKTRGSQEKDFELIEKFIRDYRGETAPAQPQPVAAPEKPAGKGGLIAGIVAGVLVLGGGAFFLLNKPKADTPVAEAPAAKTELQKTELQKVELTKTEMPKTETPKVEATKTEAPKAEAPKTAVSANANTFTGTVVNGYPDGFGTYTFKTARQIDAHDPEARMAEAGDYIKGDWREGHLNYGEWYDAAGNKKAFIRLGDNPDTKSDQKLGTCVKQR